MTEIDRTEALARARRLRGLSTDRTKLTAFGQVICELLDMVEEARAGLAGLERVKDGDGWEFCAVCNNWMDARHPEAGHADNCRLIPLLAEHEHQQDAALQAAREGK